MWYNCNFPVGDDVSRTTKRHAPLHIAVSHFMPVNNALIQVEGYRHGTRWANCRAAPEQPQRLAILRQRLDAARSISWKTFFAENGPCGYTRAELVAFEILGTESGVKRADAGLFWKDVLGDKSSKVDQLPFLRGFAEGAIDHGARP